jgi:hypothetical protein
VPTPVSPPPAVPVTNTKPKLEAKLVIEKIAEFFKTMDPKQKKIFAILEVIIIILVVLLIISAAVSVTRKKEPTVIEPTPEPVIPTPVPQNLPPSKYATDSAVLQIEQGSKQLEFDLNNFVYRDTDLRLPDIYFDKRIE